MKSRFYFPSCFVVLGLCFVTMIPAHTAENPKDWHFYADATVQPQADDSFASVYADFSRLLTRDLRQAGAALDENSIRVAPLIDGKPRAFVPARLVKDDRFDATKKAAGTVVFLVAGSKTAGPQVYRVYFDTQKNGPKPEMKNDIQVPQNANMIWNGGFEILPEGHTGTNIYKNASPDLPIGWWGNLKNNGILENPATEAHSGEVALAFGAPAEGENIGIRCTPSPPGLRVVPGENYFFSLWVTGSGLTPSKIMVLSSVYWYDKAGTYLSLTPVTNVPKNVEDFPWTKVEISIPAPADAYFAAQRLVTCSPTGLLTLDDLEARLLVPPALRGAKANP